MNVSKFFCFAEKNVKITYPYELDKKFLLIAPFPPFFLERNSGNDCIDISIRVGMQSLPPDGFIKISEFPIYGTDRKSVIYRIDGMETIHIASFIKCTCVYCVEHISKKEIYVRLNPNYAHLFDKLMWDSVLSALSYSFLFQKRLFVHASCVLNNGKGYLFLGKSGRGKSTHSKLWLKHIHGTELLNDDVPILLSDGQINKVYGSAWSGKTKCYKNLSGDMGGVVLLHQSQKNRILRADKLRAMSILIPCIIGDMRWDSFVHNYAMNIVGNIVEHVPIYDMWCTPTKEAALLCFDRIQNNE